ncbi:uncharacterized protein Z518_05413 [Rhinocladiella mackenziei CBS 650.93]|uniref:NIMA interactive protein n=1 Tax=Rhinocladiella mackenziei CBS 650.93 TaxID=1442369 RepID=A0A0D2H2C4_9EURO|nr:uncharacterized protein Z518_05413 [Rhinocladiella mackenziei CBS 650.93]KIX04543.1 hypothetical protein Z518_05413 [Rhinocladiella mackenziei CBS 650.93]
MESHSLERASQYLNNLLLARGLLSNGKPIDFACPDRHGQGTDATMSRVINLVHELVLRRDQDAEQRENLATNIRKARADEAQRVLDLQRLQDKNVELTRSAASAESHERTSKVALRKAEAQAKELKEQMLKMKSNLEQVRAKCLSDVRKRDVELDKLKAHLAGIQRGKKDASGMKINVINWEPEIKAREKRNGQDANSSDWSLEKETNDFLAAVLNETSTENVSLRRIITDTMEILCDLIGFEQETVDEEGENAMGTPGQYRKSRRRAAQTPEDLTSCAALADRMRAILEHCQSILRDPSFVPIEEVQIRDEQIIQLRLGWEKMAARWKGAVTMMDNWRRQMAANGEGLSAKDLSNLEFGKSVAMLPNGQPVFGADEELSSILYENSKLEKDRDEEPAYQMNGGSPPHNTMNDEEERDSDVDLLPKASPKRPASISRRVGLNIGKPIRPLQAIDLNRNHSPNRDTNSQSPWGQRVDPERDHRDGHSDAENDKLAPVESKIPRQVGLILARSKTHGTNFGVQIKRQEARLTVAEKLALVEAEALGVQKESSHDTKKRRRSGMKKTRKRSRRRSTLSPEELAALMGIE